VRQRRFADIFTIEPIRRRFWTQDNLGDPDSNPRDGAAVCEETEKTSNLEINKGKCKIQCLP
jgi:hypothetical protein